MVITMCDWKFIFPEGELRRISLWENFPGASQKMIQHRLTNEKENSIIHIPGMGIYSAVFCQEERKTEKGDVLCKNENVVIKRKSVRNRNIKI